MSRPLPCTCPWPWNPVRNSTTTAPFRKTWGSSFSARPASATPSTCPKPCGDASGRPTHSSCSIPTRRACRARRAAWRRRPVRGCTSGYCTWTAGSSRGRRSFRRNGSAPSLRPGELNPNYGYFTWLGTEHQEFRYYNRKTGARVFHSEPFIAPDVIYFDGFGGQRVYVIPSHRLVIVRTGSIEQNWDDSYLPNLLVRDIEKHASDQS